MIVQGAATTYMSVDVEKVTGGFQTFQELWAAVVTIIVACTMLWYKAGYVMFAPLFFVITLLSTTSMFSYPPVFFAESVRLDQPVCWSGSKGLARGHRCPDQAPGTLKV